MQFVNAALWSLHTRLPRQSCAHVRLCGLVIAFRNMWLRRRLGIANMAINTALTCHVHQHAGIWRKLFALVILVYCTEGQGLARWTLILGLH